MDKDVKIIPLRKFSYTRSSADEECQRKLYLSREWGDTGLSPIKEGWNLVYGNIIHKALEEFAKSGKMDLQWAIKEVQTQAPKAGYDATSTQDWCMLAVGHLMGFEQVVWPGLMNEYEIVSTEKWIEYEAKKGFLFRARQDLLLRNRFDGHLCYVDYKTTSSTKPQWIKSWNKSVQLHSSMYAMQKTTPYKVERAVVIGFYKGWKDDKKNIPCRSPLTYGYVNREFQMNPQYSYEYKAGKAWELMQVYSEFEGDPAPWIQKMPHPTLTEQFPMTGPIFARDDIAETWFRQQLIREQEISDAIVKLKSSTSLEEIQNILDTHFRQNFGKCDPSFGYGCEFEPYCWIPHVSADPLNSGYFKRHEYDFETE